MKTMKLDCQTINFLSSHSAKMMDVFKFSPMLIRWHIFLGVNLLQEQCFKEDFHVALTSTVESPNSKATLPRLHKKELDTVQDFSTFGNENKLENPSSDARGSSFSFLMWYLPYQRLVWFKKIKMQEFKQHEGNNQGRTGGKTKYSWIFFEQYQVNATIKSLAMWKMCSQKALKFAECLKLGIQLPISIL